MKYSSVSGGEAFLMRPTPIGYDKKKASRLMEERNIDVLVVTTPRNVFYTSGLWTMHPECGLLGIEDTYIVTKGGCDRMSTLDRRIFSVMK